MAESLIPARFNGVTPESDVLYFQDQILIIYRLGQPFSDRTSWTTKFLLDHSQLSSSP